MGKSLACLHNLFIFIKRVLLIISFILDLIIYYLLCWYGWNMDACGVVQLSSLLSFV